MHRAGRKSINANNAASVVVATEQGERHIEAQSGGFHIDFFFFLRNIRVDVLVPDCRLLSCFSDIRSGKVCKLHV